MKTVNNLEYYNTAEVLTSKEMEETQGGSLMEDVGCAMRCLCDGIQNGLDSIGFHRQSYLM